MIRTRLVLVNRQGTPYQNSNTAVFEDIPIDITYQISDVREPDSRRGANTKTVNLPGNREINIFFQNAFDVNISLSRFNPKKKVDAIYYVNELPVLKGHLRLMNVLIDNKTNKKVYQCNIVGEAVSIFTEIQNKYLTDLDFSAYNHSLTYSFISTNGWANLGSNVCYPLIDWGTNNSNLSYIRPQDFRCCLFVRDYLSKMFTAVGYSWTSTFLDSTFFKRLIIPPTDTPSLTQSVLDNNKFLAVADGTQTITKSLTVVSALLDYSTTTNDLIKFQTETYDTGNHFNNTNATVGSITAYSFYPTITNNYNTVLNLALNLVVKKNGTPDYTVTGIAGTITIITTFGIATLNVSSLSFTNGNSNNVTVPCNNIQLNANNNYHCEVQFTNLQLTNTAFPTLTDTWTIEAKVVSGSNFSSEFSSASVYEGSSVAVNDCIPTLIKQSDFLSWIIRLFNLYITVDKTNSKNLIIEPRPTFYLTSSLNWEKKHDDSKEDEVIPLGELDIYKAKYSYKQDGDYYNKVYQDQYGYTYGYKEQIINGDFFTNESSVEVGFSPTPYSSNPNVPSLVTPVIIKKEANAISPTRPNIRILYWSGLLTMPSSQWTFSYNSGAAFATYNTYPHAGHTDTPFAPTLDLNFGYPNKLFYTYPNLYWTTNNLYNKYYSKYINQISDINSKIVVSWFNLKANDIHSFDFRKPVFYKNAYWIVNKILNYNPLVRQSTKVELLKLTAYDDFVPGTVIMNGGLGDQNMGNARVISNSIVSSPNSVDLSSL